MSPIYPAAWIDTSLHHSHVLRFGFSICINLFCFAHMAKFWEVDKGTCYHTIVSLEPVAIYTTKKGKVYKKKEMDKTLVSNILQKPWLKPGILVKSVISSAKDNTVLTVTHEIPVLHPPPCGHAWRSVGCLDDKHLFFPPLWKHLKDRRINNILQ